MTPEKLGKYEIRGTLGRGAMGLVYDGWDPLIHRQVAIKTVRLAGADDEEATEGLARFRREAQAAGRLSHQNIVGVFDFGETDEIAYIVMEYVAGGSLKDVLDRREPLAPAWVCTIMRQVLAALAYSHARGVVHRDVKPANVMLTGEGAVKLGDFGIARIESSAATSVGAIMGTPSYMAPEQFMGEPADARSDIYAAGAMAFHLLTGTRPYEGNPSAIMQKVLNASEAPAASGRLPGLATAFDAVLQRAMAKRQEDRYQDAAAFASAIEAALCAEPEEERTVIMRAPAVTPPRVEPPPAPPKQSGNRMGLVAAAGLAVLLAAGGGAWLLTRPGPPPPAPAPEQPAPLQPVPDKLPPPSPPPALDPTQTAEKVRNAIAPLPCHAAWVAAAGAGLSVTGAAGAGEPAAQLREAASGAAGASAMDWKIATFDGPFCGVLDVVHAAAAAGPVDVVIKEGTTGLTKGRHIHSAFGGLAFPAYLRVDYFQRDGSVYHLYPQVKDAKASVPADDPSRQLAAGDTLMLGYVPRAPFAVGPPFGTDMIVAVATSKELLPGRRPNSEDSAAYLATLKQALSAAATDGAKLAAGVSLIETVAGNTSPP